jgi:predicted nucleic-acid-binding Zn-ribbon protein
MALIRKCEQCGNRDQRASWASVEDAAKDGAFETWTCPMCAWTEFDLVESETQATPAETTLATR